MGDKSGIEWCDATWNPIVGCSIVSPGCTNCYAMKMAGRIERMTPVTHYAGTTKPSKAGAVWTGRIAMAPERILTQPLRWSKHRAVFVNSMGDLFHESVPDTWIDRVFAVMALAQQHTFIVLTKRANRMLDFFSRDRVWAHIRDEYKNIRNAESLVQILSQSKPIPSFPLPNVVLGISAEDQARADERIPDLLATPAAKRIVSAEPLLGSVNFLRVAQGQGFHIDALGGREIDEDNFDGRRDERIVRLDGVIVGGESGSGARPMQIKWARSIVQQCAAAGVKCFVKQLGAEPVWEDGAFLNLRSRKGGEPTEWPEDLRVQELPWRAHD